MPPTTSMAAKIKFAKKAMAKELSEEPARGPW